MATLQKAAVASTTTARQINAVVISAGKMQKTVKVRIGIQKWDNHIRKQFSRHKNLLVHDPKSSVRTGDVISVSPGWRVSKHVRHVVSSIIVPFGTPIEDRAPVLTEEERVRERERKSREKRARRRELRRGERGDGEGKREREVVGMMEGLGLGESEGRVGEEMIEEMIEETIPGPNVEEVEAPKKKRGWFS